MSVSEAILKNKIEFQKLKEKITEENILAFFNRDPSCLFDVHHIRCHLFKTEETILNEEEKITLSGFIRILCNTMLQKKMLEKIGHSFKLSKLPNELSSDTEKSFFINKFNIGKRKKAESFVSVKKSAGTLTRNFRVEINKKPKTSAINSKVEVQTFLNKTVPEKPTPTPITHIEFFPIEKRSSPQTSFTPTVPSAEKESIENIKTSETITTKEVVESGKIPIHSLLN